MVVPAALFDVLPKLPLLVSYHRWDDCTARHRYHTNVCVENRRYATVFHQMFGVVLEGNTPWWGYICTENRVQ